MSPLPADRGVSAESPWWSTIRRAFDIPEHVSTPAARDSIARSLLRAMPLPPGDQQTFHAVFISANAHVAALIDCAREGELDIALCGHGLVSEIPGGGYREDTAANSAVATLEGHLKMQQKHRAWLDWLWTTFSSYVSLHPYIE